MARVTHPIRGIGVMASFWDFSNLTDQDGGAAGSAYSEQDPEPGIAVSEQLGNLASPIVYTAQDVDLEFRTVKAGASGGMAYRADGETDSEYRGTNEAHQVSASGVVRFSATQTYALFAAAMDPLTQRVMVVSANTTDGNAAILWDPETRTWSEDGVVVSGDMTVPALHYWPDTDTWVAFEIKDTGLSSAWYSRDTGATWAVHSEAIFDQMPQAIGPATTADDVHGNLVMCVSRNGSSAGASNNETSVYRSEDRGGSFTEYHQSQNVYSSAQVANFHNGPIVLVYVDDETDDSVKAKILADAYVDPDDVTAVSVSSANQVSVSDSIYPVTVFVDHNNVGHIYWVDKTDPEVIRHSVSFDQGVTWDPDSVGTLQCSNDGSNVNLERLLAVPSGGEVLLLHTAAGNTVGAAAATEASIWYELLGGWTNLELGAAPGVGVRDGRRSFADGFGVSPNLGSWFPQWAAPSDVGFTLTSGGVPTESMTSGGWQITTSTMNGHYETTFDITSDRIVFTWEVTCDVGGDQTAQDVIVYVRRRDGVNETEIEVRYDINGFRLHDVGAGTDIQTTALDMTAPAQFALVYTAVDEVGLLYRRPGDTKWTDAGSSITLNTAATANTTSTFRFGHFTISASTSTWGSKGYSGNMQAHIGLLAGDVSSKLRWGAELSTLPWPVRDVGTPTARSAFGVTGGPLHLGRTWRVDAAGKSRAEHLFPLVEPSPSVLWRSEDQLIATFTVDAGYDTRPGPSWILMAYVENPGFQKVKISAAPDSGSPSFTTFGDLDLGIGFSGLSYAVSGQLMKPASGTAGTRYIRPGELVGGYVVTVAGDVARIIGNTGGYWTTTAGFQQVELTLADDSVAAGSTVTLVWPRGLYVHPLDGSTAYRWWRAAFQAATTPEGVLSCGTLWLGAMLVPGRQHGRGALLDLVPQREVRTDAYGSRRVFPTGPALKQLTIGWPDGYDETNLRIQDGAGHLAASGSTAPAATYGDVRGPLESLVEVSDQGRRPLVALMSDVPETATTLTDPTTFLSGWFDGTIGTEFIQGDEGVDEVIRVQTINIAQRA